MAVCDVDARHRGRATGYVEEHYGKAGSAGVYKGCSAYQDFRDVIPSRTSMRSSLPCPTTGTPFP